MIKQTFLNLPEDKREKILSAARNELTRVPFYDARIATIVREAGIPRGSFYQYFDSLNDVFVAVLRDIEKKKLKNFVQFLTESQGDLFEAAIKMFDSEFDYLTNNKPGHLIQNIFNIAKIDGGPSIGPNNPGFEEVFALIKTESLNLKGHNDLFSLLMLFFFTIGENIRLSILNEHSKHDAQRCFLTQINFVKYGAKKK